MLKVVSTKVVMVERKRSGWFEICIIGIQWRGKGRNQRIFWFGQIVQWGLYLWRWGRKTVFWEMWNRELHLVVNVCDAFQTSKRRCQVDSWVYIYLGSGEKFDQEMTIWESSTYRWYLKLQAIMSSYFPSLISSHLFLSSPTKHTVYKIPKMLFYLFTLFFF